MRSIGERTHVYISDSESVESTRGGSLTLAPINIHKLINIHESTLFEILPGGNTDVLAKFADSAIFCHIFYQSLLAVVCDRESLCISNRIYSALKSESVVSYCASRRYI